jgi:hypothetical protein
MGSKSCCGERDNSFERVGDQKLAGLQTAFCSDLQMLATPRRILGCSLGAFVGGHGAVIYWVGSGAEEGVKSTQTVPCGHSGMRFVARLRNTNVSFETYTRISAREWLESEVSRQTPGC